jgi:hypothetical protein
MVIGGTLIPAHRGGAQPPVAGRLEEKGEAASGDVAGRGADLVAGVVGRVHGAGGRGDACDVARLRGLGGDQALDGEADEAGDRDVHDGGAQL